MIIELMNIDKNVEAGRRNCDPDEKHFDEMLMIR